MAITTMNGNNILMLPALILLLAAGPASGWHNQFASGPGATADFHCWQKAKASGGTVDVIDPCTGIDMHWIDTPGAEVKAGHAFNMTYSMILQDSFFPWAASNGYFSFLNTTNATVAKDWCLNTACPTDKNAVTGDNCCISHVNVHSCLISATTSFCGPWIPPGGQSFTHSEVLWGTGRVHNWTSGVPSLGVEGTHQLIGHFKVADIQTTIYINIKATPKFVCGDSLCETAEGETCTVCPTDCGACPLAPYVIGIIAAIGALIVVAIIVVLCYLRWQQQKMLYDESWIIPWDNIQMDTQKRGFMGSAISLGAASATKETGGNALAQNAANKQIFTTTAIYKGVTVAMKKVPKNKGFVLNKCLRLEAKLLREADHANVVRFVGACLETPHVCILSDYCPKGSLSDILMNEDVPLNWGFRFSLATDITRGMKHLHHRGIIHGRLKSTNCIVDDRWTLKLTDFGMPSLRKRDPEAAEDDEEEDEEWKEKKALVYRAPETFFPGYVPHAPEDVYAFAIILVEIGSRNDPYGDDDVDDYEPGWRPTIPEELDEIPRTENSCPCPQDYIHLIKECWATKPHDRPDFEHIRKIIHRINPSKKSPVDLMMAMMEKYSKHLEAIVGERTADLIVEKQKTDRLLHSMLPASIADKLKAGEQISATQFAGCTIYFSDIVGFTNIAGGSTPFQVVALLNALYICFDTIIDEYDVYKVETIGDAYMVVSGVPKINGDRHAYEIAMMSVDIISACLTFQIPHMPDVPLKIRVGLHSGPVCAGVVGLKMPRYCLFGDTVNTASRMESNGEAYKIHISEPCQKLLEPTGCFNIERRGTIPVKGKGEMTTYWLHDRVKGFKPPVWPDDPMLPPVEDDHIEEIVMRDTKSAGNKDKEQRKVSQADSGYNERAELPEAVL